MTGPYVLGARLHQWKSKANYTLNNALTSPQPRPLSQNVPPSRAAGSTGTMPASEASQHVLYPLLVPWTRHTLDMAYAARLNAQGGFTNAKITASSPTPNMFGLKQQASNQPAVRRKLICRHPHFTVSGCTYFLYQAMRYEIGKSLPTGNIVAFELG